MAVRKLPRRLSDSLHWNIETVQVVLRVERTEAEGIVRALVEAGLAVAEQSPRGNEWTMTQLAKLFASATAAKLIKRQTAARALAEPAYQEHFSPVLLRLHSRSTDASVCCTSGQTMLPSYLMAHAGRTHPKELIVLAWPTDASGRGQTMLQVTWAARTGTVSKAKQKLRSHRAPQGARAVPT